MIPSVTEGFVITPEWGNAVAAAINGLVPKRFAVTGAAISGSFAPAEATVQSLAIPAQPVAGIVYVFSNLFHTKTASDQHTVSLKENGTVIAQERTLGLGQPTAHIAMSRAVAEGVALTYVVTMIRDSGTGNATTFADSRNNRLEAIFLPIVA